MSTGSIGPSARPHGAALAFGELGASPGADGGRPRRVPIDRPPPRRRSVRVTRHHHYLPFVKQGLDGPGTETLHFARRLVRQVANPGEKRWGRCVRTHRSAPQSPRIGLHATALRPRPERTHPIGIDIARPVRTAPRSRMYLPWSHGFVHHAVTRQYVRVETLGVAIRRIRRARTTPWCELWSSCHHGDSPCTEG